MSLEMTVAYVLIFCRATIGLVFLMSCMSKALDIKHFRRAIDAFEILSHRYIHFYLPYPFSFYDEALYDYLYGCRAKPVISRFFPCHGAFTALFACSGASVFALKINLSV